MTKNSALSTFLIISIVIILLGVFVVVVTQLDNAQAGFITPASFEQEQSNIIQQVYKIHAEQTTAITQKPQPTSQTPLSNEAARALQAEVDQYQPELIPTPRLDNAYNMWSNQSQPVVNPYYSLKNNPWSPDYKPGY